MIVTKKRPLLKLLAFVLCFMITGTCANVFAITTTDTFTYPMRTGEYALENAPTLVSYTEQAAGDTWHWFEAAFDNVTDLTGASYLAVEFEGVKTAYSLTFGIMGGNTRYGTYTDAAEAAYYVTEGGTITAKDSHYGGYIQITAGEKGMLLIPMTMFTKVSWDSAGDTLVGARSFFIETNAYYNYNWEVKIGEIGYYTGEPANGGTYTKLLNIASGEKKSQYTFVNGLTGKFPSDAALTLPGTQVEYPFATDEFAFKNATVWAGPTESSGGSDNWQTFRMFFDDGATDLSAATYIAVQYLAKQGAPGITYGLETAYWVTRHSIVGSSGNPVYMIGTDGVIYKACDITYNASNISTTGALLIPMSYFKAQWGTQDMTEITNLVFTTNSLYNWAFEIGVGAVGYYTGNPGGTGSYKFTYHSLIAFDNTANTNMTVTCDNNANAGRMYVNKIDKTNYGDTKLFVFATNKNDGSLIPWDGGAAGQQTMTTDTYGDEAYTLVCKGPRENADLYTAFTMFDGHYDLTWAKGITLWARNDSAKEVSFNLEVDCKGTEAQGARNARFNVKQGNRFWLYDVNTGKQTIYMTRPCVTLPAGFEGWVRIPFTCFAQADWDVNNGAVPANQFMKGTSYCSYIGITIFSGDYTDMAFSVNKIGGYAETPSFTSALVPASETAKNIPMLMGLN